MKLLGERLRSIYQSIINLDKFYSHHIYKHIRPEFGGLYFKFVDSKNKDHLIDSTYTNRSYV